MRLFGRKSDRQEDASPKSEPDTPRIELGALSPNARASSSKSDLPVGTDRLLIPSSQLEKSRRELKTLLFEKELAAAALTRLYEAEALGEITREERETLASRYREQVKELDGKIIKIDAFIEVGDLEVLREQLLELVRQKIEQIEKRIDRTKPLAGSLIEPLLAPTVKEKAIPEKPFETDQPKPRVPDISDLLAEQPKVVSPATGNQSSLETVAPQIQTRASDPEKFPADSRMQGKRRSENAENNSEDSEVDDLQKELREALDRLEKLDIET